MDLILHKRIDKADGSDTAKNIRVTPGNGSGSKKRRRSGDFTEPTCGRARDGGLGSQGVAPHGARDPAPSVGDVRGPGNGPGHGKGRTGDEIEEIRDFISTIVPDLDTKPPAGKASVAQIGPADNEPA